MIQIWKSLFFTDRFFASLFAVTMLFLLSYFFPILYFLSIGTFLLIMGVSLIEVFILFRKQNGIEGERAIPKRLSNGDDNDIIINISNRYPMDCKLEIIDEIPFQFQRRDINWFKDIESNESLSFTYSLKPVKRGEYHFGSLNILSSLGAHMVQRKFSFDNEAMVPVFPSFLQMRKYELAAFTSDLSELGIKRIRRVGQSLEFDQIKEYQQGDDPRAINWKATARRNNLMVNHYIDEKSQPMYCLIDKGRQMKMPFDNMTLLDYAINASLVISNIAIKKEDKAGLISYSNKLSSALKADNRPSQIFKIQELLYSQLTQFAESNLELLSSFVRRRITQRSLLFLFTNFESYASFQRQLKYFKVLGKHHLLVVIFFRNTGLKELIESDPNSVQGVYTQVIAEKSEFEKHMIVKELSRHGIYSILTTPKGLNINIINKYLEMKARGLF